MRRILLLLCLGVAVRADAQVITLDSVLHTIDRSYPMIKMYDAMADAREDYARSASSWMPPKLSAGLWQTPYSSIKDGMLMIGVEQMIPNPSKTGAKASMMRSEAALDRASRSVTLRDMHTMAKRAYYGRSVLERKLHAVAETDSLLSLVIAVATERYPTGKELLENIYKAKAERAELVAMRTMVGSEIVMKDRELLNLLGLRDAEFRIDTTLPKIVYAPNVSPVSPSSDTFTVTREIDASIGMMQAKREYEHSALYPEFGVSLSHMQSLNTMMPNQFSLMGMISVPIAPWSRTEADAMTSGVDREIESLRLKRQAALREQETNAAMFATERRAIKWQLDAIDTSVLPARRRSFEASLGAYEQNAGDLFRVIDAWQMLRMAEMNRLDVLQSLINAEVSYEDAIATD